MNKFLPINNTLLLYLAYENQGSGCCIYGIYTITLNKKSTLTQQKPPQHSSVLIIYTVIIRLWQTNRFLTHISFVKTTY